MNLEKKYQKEIYKYAGKALVDLYDYLKENFDPTLTTQKKIEEALLEDTRCKKVFEDDIEENLEQWASRVKRGEFTLEELKQKAKSWVASDKWKEVFFTALEEELEKKSSMKDAALTTEELMRRQKEKKKQPVTKQDLLAELQSWDNVLEGIESGEDYYGWTKEDVTKVINNLEEMIKKTGHSQERNSLNQESRISKIIIRSQKKIKAGWEFTLDEFEYYDKDLDEYFYRDLEIEYYAEPEEGATRDYPGYPGYFEITNVRDAETGEDLESFFREKGVWKELEEAAQKYLRKY